MLFIYNQLIVLKPPPTQLLTQPTELSRTRESHHRVQPSSAWLPWAPGHLFISVASSVCSDTHFFSFTFLARSHLRLSCPRKRPGFGARIYYRNSLLEKAREWEGQWKPGSGWVWLCSHPWRGFRALGKLSPRGGPGRAGTAPGFSRVTPVEGPCAAHKGAGGTDWGWLEPEVWTTGWVLPALWCSGPALGQHIHFSSCFTNNSFVWCCISLTGSSV